MNKENSDYALVTKSDINSDQIETDENSIANDKRTRLINEIRKMRKRIHKIRKQMAVRYMKADVPFKAIMKTKSQAKSNVDDSQPNSKRMRMTATRTLELLFHGMFIKLNMTKDLSVITVLLPLSGKQTFGLKFARNPDTKLYKLVCCCMPYSLNIYEEMKKANAMSQLQIIEYVQNMQRIIYAYNMRLDQIKQLQMDMDETLLQIYRNLSCTHIELTFSVTSRTGDRGKFVVTVVFNYNRLHVLPKKLSVISPNNDLTTKELKLVLCKMAPHTNLPLPELYATIFAERPLKWL